MRRGDLGKFKMPDSPGVYYFKKGREILYIGKAASLRDRVRSYFSADLVGGRGSAIVQMVAEAETISWQTTESVLEALILEANLIKRHQPSYNAASKDNKSFNYLVITKEDFPRVIIVRGRELFHGWNKAKIGLLFGSFPHGGQLQEAIKMVRRIFPFHDMKCVPCAEQLRRRGLFVNSNELTNKQLSSGACRPCFNRQIGLCPGVCTGEISKAKYARTIRNIKDLFSGKFRGLKQRLAREMKAAAKVEDFGRAEELRRQVSALEHIQDVSLIKAERRVSMGGPALSAERAGRIEAYDVAHTSGAETVAVLTVVEDGEPRKSEYRKFKIRSAKNNDVAALKEALSRRLGHPEWPLPRIFVVDGGKAQLRAAESVLKNVGISIPVVAVTKDEFHRPKGIIGNSKSIEAHEKEILLSNSEAHRFGIAYHRKQLRKGMI